MNRSLRFQFIIIVVLTIGALYAALHRIRPGIDLAGGAELRYKVLFDSKFSGDRPRATREATDVIRRRLESKQMKEPKITSRGNDEIVLQLPGLDAEELKEVKRLIEKTGDLKLYAAAAPELQERYERDHVEPEGCTIVGGNVLVEARPVIEGRHIIAAEPRQEAGIDGVQWVTTFELDGEGARRFDEAAERLYRRQPRGRIVIVLDKEVRSMPVVNSPAFHGRGQITSARQERK